jgi:hypothetical protein
MATLYPPEQRRSPPPPRQVTATQLLQPAPAHAAFYRLADRNGNPWYGMSARRDAVSHHNMG